MGLKVITTVCVGGYTYKEMLVVVVSGSGVIMTWCVCRGGHTRLVSKRDDGESEGVLVVVVVVVGVVVVVV